MSAAAREAAAPLESHAARAESASGDGLGAAVGALFGAFRDQARHVGELAAAETRLAAVSAVAMVVLGVLLAAALMMTWALLIVLAIDGLRRLGLSWQLATGLLALLQLLAAYALWRGVIGLSGNLSMPRLRRTLLSEEHASARRPSAME